MGSKTRSNYSTGGSKLTDIEWRKLFMSDAMSDIENGIYNGDTQKIDRKAIDKVINSFDMYENLKEIEENKKQKVLHIMNAFSIINLTVTKKTAFEFLKALELENIVIMEK